MINPVSYSNCTDGELRTDPNELGNSVNETRGRLEICANNVWFSIYSSSTWYRYSPTRALACRSLGYGDIGILPYTLHVQFLLIIICNIF